MISESMQDYLKVIYKLSTAGAEVSSSAIADGLGVSAASVTNMIKKLTDLKLARHTPYQGVELTPAGSKVALEVIRHHRLLEAYLSEALGYPWDEVHAEAEKLEHVISEEFESRIAETLGNPTRDPHGDPIPTRDGQMEDVRHESLADLPPVGQAGVVRRVSDHSPERLRYLATLGLRPDVAFMVLERAPFHGPIRLRVGKKEISVGTELAQEIYVSAPK
jgi:DtxR family Mn-dependent transcriptional regulator